jgi:GNAT superfamily N-acetyltransferase
LDRRCAPPTDKSVDPPEPLLRLGEHSTGAGCLANCDLSRGLEGSWAEVRPAPATKTPGMELRRTPANSEEMVALLPAFADMYARMIRECGLDGQGFVDDWHDRLVAYFTGELRRGAMALYLAKVGGEIVGSAAVFINDGRTNQVLRDRVATIAGVFIEPAFRSRGIARALTESAVAWARGQGCASIRLSSSKDAEPLYRSLGFQDGRELVLKL